MDAPVMLRESDFLLALSSNNLPFATFKFFKIEIILVTDSKLQSHFFTNSNVCH